VLTESTTPESFNVLHFLLTELLPILAGCFFSFWCGVFFGRKFPRVAKAVAGEVAERKKVIFRFTANQTITLARLYDQTGTTFQNGRLVVGSQEAVARLWDHIHSLLPKEYAEWHMELETTDSHQRWSITLTEPSPYRVDLLKKQIDLADPVLVKPVLVGSKQLVEKVEVKDTPETGPNSEKPYAKSTDVGGLQ
jgi:hypothetical protein